MLTSKRTVQPWRESSVPVDGRMHHEGLNFVLADVTAKSTEKQTRNSAGKTSIVEIIHGAGGDLFMTFDDCEKVGAFSSEAKLQGPYH